MTNEERGIFYMNRNIKLYPPYLSITWDMLFVWTILTMFYTQVKGLTFSQAVLLDSVQMLSACIICIPLTKALSKVKPVMATRIGNFAYMACILLIIFGKSFAIFSLAHICLGFAYIIQSVKSVSILNDSLHAVERDKDYQRVYGKGVSLYYVLEAITAILATYLFQWNPYSALWCAFGVIVIAQIFSFLLKEPNKYQTRNANILPHLTYKERKARKPDSFIKVLSSSFVIVLLIYAFLMRGALSLDTTQFRIYLQQLTTDGSIPLWLFGYIFATMRLCAALSSRYQFKFNLKFGVRSLIIIALTFILSTLAIGFVYVFMPNNLAKIIILVVLMILVCMVRPPNNIFLNNYMQVCTDIKNYEKMYALRTIAEYAGYACLNAMYAQLLTTFNNNFGYANFVYIGVLAIPILVALVAFIKVLAKKFAQKYTIIRPEYTEDDE